MIQFTYQELYRINPLEARKILRWDADGLEGSQRNVEESIVPGDRFGAQTLAGVVKFETFNQCLNLHEKASSRT